VTFKTDEILPLDAAVTLRGHGFDLETIWDEGLSGADDATVAGRAQAELYCTPKVRHGR
jgi:hypothetical protein